MRFAGTVVEQAGNALLAWWALGTILRQLFPRWCDSIMEREVAEVLAKRARDQAF